MSWAAWLLCPAALALGCGAEPAPVVEVLGATPTSLDPSRDEANDLVIRVRYEDADGDLGGGRSEVYDCRAEDLVVTLPIPALATAEAVAEGVSIAGELSLYVNDVGTVAPGTSPVCAGLGAPATAFCVVLVDDVGHRSEGDCTEALLFPEGP